METNKSSCLRVCLYILFFVKFTLLLFVVCACVSDGIYVYMNFRFTFWWWPFVRQMSYPCALCENEEKKNHENKKKKEISLPSGRLHLLNCEHTVTTVWKGNKIRIRYRRFYLVLLRFFSFYFESVTYLIIAGLVIIFFFFFRLSL